MKAVWITPSQGAYKHYLAPLGLRQAPPSGSSYSLILNQELR